MFKLTTLFAVALSTLLTSGCAIDAATPTTADATSFDEFHFVAAGSEASAALIAGGDFEVLYADATDGDLYITDELGSETVMESESEICLCTSDDCVRDWIVAEMGCGVCVTVRCGEEGTNRGGCVPCQGTVATQPGVTAAATPAISLEDAAFAVTPADTNPVQSVRQ